MSPLGAGFKSPRPTTIPPGPIRKYCYLRFLKSMVSLKSQTYSAHSNLIDEKSRNSLDLIRVPIGKIRFFRNSQFLRSPTCDENRPSH